MNTNNASSNLAESAEIEIGEDILGIHGPVDIPSGWEWVWWTLGFILLAALLYWLARKFLSRVKIVRTPRAPYIAPHTLARRKLSAAMKWIGDPYRFCTAVSDALREYIEGQFSLHAPERTTDEFLVELHNDPSLTPAQQEMVEGFLNQCDLVKFAKETPALDQLEHLHSTAQKLVEDTMSSDTPGIITKNEEAAS
jgi:hypothetical protein